MSQAAATPISGRRQTHRPLRRCRRSFAANRCGLTTPCVVAPATQASERASAILAPFVAPGATGVPQRPPDGRHLGPFGFAQPLAGGRCCGLRVSWRRHRRRSFGN